ncbi:alpha/beta hydrolase-fold protein [Chitinophaga vietnamensis]|uniref:alpha/beta hydrolase-fold protein n=1 Tax=Chitinophaga vietnamensis TaxID=2593957 RepID=UPI001178A8E2|nr:alpha/beta hydrolase-fold protein [Chitinophaga vietnamensis]
MKITPPLFISLLISISLYAQQNAIRDSIYSNILKEKRYINVIMPQEPPQTGVTEHDAVFCLDDVFNFQKTETAFLQGEGFIPKDLLLIGIPNMEHDGVFTRDRDLTPTGKLPRNGGADQFILFLREELLPYVHERYHVKMKGNTLCGGSLAGLFTVYAFLKSPDLFTSYIAGDPSLWWDQFAVSQLAAHCFDSIRKMNNTLFITGREGAAYHYMGIDRIDSVLRAKAPAGLDWKVMLVDNESHFSTNFKCFWEGMKFSYGGFYASAGGYNTSRDIVINPDNGIILPGKPFTMTCYNLNPGAIHYAIGDTLTSTPLAGEETPITLSNSATITFTAVGKRPEYRRVLQARFEAGTPLPAAPKPAAVIAGGLRYRFYKGDWNTATRKPDDTGRIDKDFNPAKFSREADFSLVAEGWLEITTPGYYTFEIGSSNDYTKVSIGGKQVLGLHFKTGTGEHFLLPLEKGFYPLQIIYNYKKGGNDPQAVYIKPDAKEDYPLPLEHLYSR